MKIDYLLFSERRNVYSSATFTMITTVGTIENPFKFLIAVKRLFRRAYVINAGHDAK
jgi:hypothetical protein